MKLWKFNHFHLQLTAIEPLASTQTEAQNPDTTVVVRTG